MTTLDWLKKEVDLVPRKKFFMFEPVSSAELERVEMRFGQLPHDYKEFVEQYGKAKMFLEPRTPLYLVEVTAPPEVYENIVERGCTGKSAAFIKLGFYFNSGHIGLKYLDGEYLSGGAIFATVEPSGPSRKSAESFGQWLMRTFNRCRREAYTKEEWEAIHTPVPPFSLQEQRVVQARQLFKFRKVGVSSEGNVLVEVSNNATIELPYLSVGVRLDQEWTGGCALPTSGIAPGTSRILEYPMYKGIVDPEKIELFCLPLPDAEDRPYYLELVPRGRVFRID